MCSTPRASRRCASSLLSSSRPPVSPGSTRFRRNFAPSRTQYGARNARTRWIVSFLGMSGGIIVGEAMGRSVGKPCAAALLLWAVSAGAAPRDAWPDYRAIVWHPQKAGSCAALKEAGIDAGAVIPENRDEPARGLEQRIAPLRDCGLSWYVENIATDFYSAYHRYTPGKPVNWRFIEVKKAYQARDPGAFLRDPSLSDPVWQKKIRDRLTETVRVHRAYKPLFY